MNKIILIALLVVSCKLMAQDLNYIKSQDTLYIALSRVYRNKTERQVFKKFTLESFGSESTEEYKFIDSIGKHIYIQVYNSGLNKENTNSITINRKKFLKKNNSNIITIDFITQFYPDELFINHLGIKTFAQGNKVIYIIDEDSLKRKSKNIVLRKANITAVSYAEF